MENLLPEDYILATLVLVLAGGIVHAFIRRRVVPWSFYQEMRAERDDAIALSKSVLHDNKKLIDSHGQLIASFGDSARCRYSGDG